MYYSNSGSAYYLGRGCSCFWEEALNYEQVGLVQQTCAKLKPVSNTAAELLLQAFEIDSSTRDLFENDMHDQGELLMGMIDVVVALLVKTDLVVPALQD